MTSHGTGSGGVGGKMCVGESEEDERGEAVVTGGGWLRGCKWSAVKAARTVHAVLRSEARGFLRAKRQTTRPLPSSLASQTSATAPPPPPPRRSTALRIVCIAHSSDRHNTSTLSLGSTQRFSCSLTRYSLSPLPSPALLLSSKMDVSLLTLLLTAVIGAAVFGFIFTQSQQKSSSRQFDRSDELAELQKTVRLLIERGSGSPSSFQRRPSSSLCRSAGSLLPPPMASPPSPSLTPSPTPRPPPLAPPQPSPPPLPPSLSALGPTPRPPVPKATTPPTSIRRRLHSRRPPHALSSCRGVSVGGYKQGAANRQLNRS